MAGVISHAAFLERRGLGDRKQGSQAPGAQLHRSASRDRSVAGAGAQPKSILLLDKVWFPESKLPLSIY
jgi:hypothetical protein